ncbi:MAG: hypothetical protein RL226_2017 [Bacteroidota bacterium]|jgi:hypothetical protein
MIRRGLLFLFAILNFASLHAQLNEEVWTITGKKFLGEGFRKWKFDIVFDGRRSFANGETVSIGGLRMGLEYKRVHRFGVGIYQFTEDIVVPMYTTTDTAVSPARFIFGYGSLYYERVLYLHPKWEISATGHLGRGNINIDFFNTKDGYWERLETRDVRPIELSTSAYHHLSWWLSAGLGVGYRWMFDTPPNLRGLYSSTVYLAKVKIRVGKAIRRIGNEKVKYEY